jgi:hypothetical protein
VLINTIQNDFDAAKTMNEDISRILPLQIAPQVLSNYNFVSHASMLRFVFLYFVAI